MIGQKPHSGPNEGIRSLSQPRERVDGPTGEGKVGAAEPPAPSGRGLRNAGLGIPLGSHWQDDMVAWVFGFCSGVQGLVPSLAEGLAEGLVDW